MLKFLKDNWFKIGLLVLLAIIIGDTFYWNEIRPAKIYSTCYKKAADQASDLLREKVELGATQYSKSIEKGLFLTKDYEGYYRDCLRQHGIYK